MSEIYFGVKYNLVIYFFQRNLCESFKIWSIFNYNFEIFLDCNVSSAAVALICAAIEWFTSTIIMSITSLLLKCWIIIIIIIQNWSPIFVKPSPEHNSINQLFRTHAALNVFLISVWSGIRSTSCKGQWLFILRFL